MAHDPSSPLKGKAEPFAFARACGYGIWDSARRAGANPETGQGSKWEARADVQARIRWWRLFGQNDEMLAEKRARLEARLELAAFGNVFDFATVVDRVILTPGEGEDAEPEQNIVKTPVIDWDKVAASPLSAIISGFKFDKDTGVLVDFERDSALQAIVQLRDMHGFKSATKNEHTGPGGGPIQVTSDADRVRALKAFMTRAGAGGAPQP